MLYGGNEGRQGAPSKRGNEVDPDEDVRVRPIDGINHYGADRHRWIEGPSRDATTRKAPAIVKPIARPKKEGR